MKKINNKYPVWKNWLRVNSELHFIEKKRRYAWRDVKGAYDPNYMLSKQISLYYEALPPEQMLLFREGLVLCLLELPQKKTYIPIFNELIKLSVECDCYEIVNSQFFEKIIFKGKLGFLNNKYEKDNDLIDIFYTVINALRYFTKFGTGKKIVSMGYKMARSPYFPHQYVYLLFLILCRSEPKRLFSHWKAIRHIHFLFSEKLSDDEKSYPVLKTELSRILDLEVLEDFHKKLVKLDDYRPEDEWLLHILELKIEEKDEKLSFGYKFDENMIPKNSSPRYFGSGFINDLKEKMPKVYHFFAHKMITGEDVMRFHTKSEFKVIENDFIQEEDIYDPADLPEAFKIANKREKEACGECHW